VCVCVCHGLISLGSNVSPRLKHSVLIADARALTQVAAQCVHSQPSSRRRLPHWKSSSFKLLTLRHPPRVHRVIVHVFSLKCKGGSAHLFIPLRNSNSLVPSGMLKTLMTVPCGGERGQTGRSQRAMKRKEGSFKKRDAHPLRSAGKFGAGAIEGEGRQGTVVGLDQRQGALNGEYISEDNGTSVFFFFLELQICFLCCYTTVQKFGVT